MKNDSRTDNSIFKPILILMIEYKNTIVKMIMIQTMLIVMMAEQSTLYRYNIIMKILMTIELIIILIMIMIMLADQSTVSRRHTT